MDLLLYLRHSLPTRAHGLRSTGPFNLPAFPGQFLRMAQELVLGEATVQVDAVTGLPTVVTGVDPMVGGLGAPIAGGLLIGSRTVRGEAVHGRSGGVAAHAQHQIGLDGLKVLGAPMHRGRVGLDARRVQHQRILLLLQ